jgi:hypothetical protein
MKYTKVYTKKLTPDIPFQGTTMTTLKEKASVIGQALFPV